MTATRDRRRDQGRDARRPRDRRQAPGEAPLDERPLLGTSRGLLWWAAVLLALGLSVVGAAAELGMSGSLGRVFQGAYFVGCVAAVCLIRQRHLFGAVVQPPLICGVTVPVMVLITNPPRGGGLEGTLLTITNPLINTFPAMAITTGVTLVIGVARLVLHRHQVRGPTSGPTSGPSRGTSRAPVGGTTSSRTAGRAGATGGQRRSSGTSGRGDRGRTTNVAGSKRGTAQPSRGEPPRPWRAPERGQDRGRDTEPGQSRGQGSMESQARRQGDRTGRSGTARSPAARDAHPPRQARPGSDAPRQPRRRRGE